MRKTTVLIVVLIAFGLAYNPRSAFSQEEPKKESVAPPNKSKTIEPFRLDFSFSELEDGKQINTRHYSMNLTAGESNEIKIGTRVPVSTGTGVPSQFQYIDVGTNIWAQLRERGDDPLVLVVRSEVSNLDVTKDGPEKYLPPIVRQIKISGDTLLVVGKSIVIGSMDDPNSKRQFQLEVVITKLVLSRESACTFYDRQNNAFEGKCGIKKGDALNAYCTVDSSKVSDPSQYTKDGKKLYQLQAVCLGI